MLKIEINTENAAFGCDLESKWEQKYYRNEEIKRILKDICNQLDNGYDSGSCLDINGNVVGRWQIE